MSKPSKRKWEDITEMLTPKGIAELKAGRTLTFERPGAFSDVADELKVVRTTLKIMRNSGGRVWAKEIRLYTPDEVEVVEKEES